jgi:hypothetical protein
VNLEFTSILEKAREIEDSDLREACRLYLCAIGLWSVGTRDTLPPEEAHRRIDQYNEMVRW